MQRELWYCSGKLIPEDKNLTLTETRLDADDLFTSTTEIRGSIVYVELDISAADEGIDDQFNSTIAQKTAQYIAELWLSVLSFGEGGNYSTLITKIVYGIHGPDFEYSPILKTLECDDLRIHNMNNLMQWLGQLASASIFLEWLCRIMPALCVIHRMPSSIATAHWKP